MLYNVIKCCITFFVYWVTVSNSSYNTDLSDLTCEALPVTHGRLSLQVCTLIQLVTIQVMLPLMSAWLLLTAYVWPT